MISTTPNTKKIFSSLDPDTLKKVKREIVDLFEERCGGHNLEPKTWEVLVIVCEKR